jgi:CBS domain-containing protein
VKDLLPEPPDVELAVANPDDTVLELAALMARAHSPLVAVVENDLLLGCVTLPRLLEVLLPDRAA